MIPDYAKDIYPNPVQYIYGKPVFVFRDHRWTIPVIYIAGEKKLLKIPAKIVIFDRHKDSLSPLNGTEALRKFRSENGSFNDLIDIVMKQLSPRDDDWIVSGMELGLISDVVQFSSEEEKVDSDEPVSVYTDSSGAEHRIYHLGRPLQELSYKGALADTSHETVSEGLWEVLGWNPSKPGFAENVNEFILDIDLDFFTFIWDKYTFAFTREVYEGEFLSPCQSLFYEEYLPLNFIRELIKKAALLTVACEPSFCGGPQKARNILVDVNDFFLEKELNVDRIKVDYTPVYPDE